MQNKTGIQLISPLILLLLLSSCAKFAKVDMNTMPDTLAERPIEFEPVAESQGKSTRIVTRIRQPISPHAATKHNILKRLEQYLDKELGKQSAAPVDRGLNKTVKDEIELAEIYGKSSSRQDVDYVLLLVLDDYQKESSTTQKESLFDAKKKYYKCEYGSNYAGWIRVYEIPSMKVVDQWEIDQSKSDSFEEKQASACNSKFNNKLEALHSKMINNTVCQSEQHLRNVMAPSGHVLAMNKTEKDIMYDISIGSSLKVNADDTILFYHKLSNEPYAEGKVIKGVKSHSATVMLTSIKENETVYRGDWVRPHYSSVMTSLKCMF